MFVYNELKYNQESFSNKVLLIKILKTQKSLDSLDVLPKSIFIYHFVQAFMSQLNEENERYMWKVSKSQNDFCNEQNSYFTIKLQ